MKNNIVITGRGLVTPLGTGLERNETALRNGESGIVFAPQWKEVGLESQIAGLIDENLLECPLFNKKNKRYMSPNVMMGTVAAYEAIQEAGLDLETLQKKRVAIVLGHGGSTHQIVHEGARILETTGKSKRVSPFTVPKVMPSSAVSSLSLILGITGETFTVSSACASGAHAVMVASRLLQTDLYDIVITGGTEEVSWVHALGFDSMRALSRSYNDTPTKASRPFDQARDGFVISAGAGIMILESEEHAKSRNAKPIVKVASAIANSNATDMVFPDAASSAKLMKEALGMANLKPSDIDYVNTHGTSTPVGDPVEMNSLKTVFEKENKDVAINSTKSMTGHMIGATGAVEIIFCSQMIDKGFICPTINLENPDPDFEWANLVRETIPKAKVKHALSNSFGFGGTNSCVILSTIE
ncbi:MAG: beta-ketoacyl-[acyl-carrier-protein] synthase family protein [bacterium]|nr:beta-ketoacyl-[acyl-carrier-protein] synthase family protein [bacterium]